MRNILAATLLLLASCSPPPQTDFVALSYEAADTLLQGARGEVPYSWFTEGFDTADLKDAKALLDELR